MKLSLDAIMQHCNSLAYEQELLAQAKLQQEAQKLADEVVSPGEDPRWCRVDVIDTRSTQVGERLKVTVVISENHGYQIIRSLQMNRAGRSFGNEFRARDDATHRLEGDYVTIDFAQNAASMGARTWHVTTPDAGSRSVRGGGRASRHPANESGHG